MRKVLLTTLALVGTALFGVANVTSAMEHKGDMAQKNEKMFSPLRHRLELTDQQVEELRSLSAGQAELAQETMETIKGIHKQLHALNPVDSEYENSYNQLASQLGDATKDMAILRSQRKQTIASVLTPEQLEKLSTMKKARFDHMGERGKKHNHKQDLSE